MNLVIEAAWKLHLVLESHQLRYALIGGVALQFWGDVRQTADVDAAILVELGREEDVARLLAQSFEIRRPDAVEFSSGTECSCSGLKACATWTCRSRFRDSRKTS